MNKDEALRLAEEAIMDELEAVTAEEFEDAAGKLDDALRAIWKALKEPTIRDNLIVEPEVFCGWCKCLPCVCKLLELPTANAALVDAVDMTEKCVEETVECGHEPVAWKRESDGALFSFEIYEGLTPLYAAPVEPVKQETVALLKSSKANFERQFGKQVFADWIYDDLTYSFENYTTQPVKQEPESLFDWKHGHPTGLKSAAPVEPVKHADWCASLTQILMSYPPQPAACNCQNKLVEPVAISKTETTSEPVAWMVVGDGQHGFYKSGEHFDSIECRDYWERRGYEIVPVYTTPQPRKDVDLTDDEIEEIDQSYWSINDRRLSFTGFARAVLAKYKEKNSGN